MFHECLTKMLHRLAKTAVAIVRHRVGAPEAQVRELLALPKRLPRGPDRKRGRLTRRDVSRLQTALAVAILLAAPVRVANLAGLRLDRHLLRQGSGWGEVARVRLALPGSEVKNNHDLEHPLPPWVVQLLDLGCSRVRARASPRPRKSRAGRSRTRRPQEGLGLRLTPHCFATFVGWFT